MRSAVIAGVSPERFWRLTLAEISLEVEAWIHNQEIMNYRFGMLCVVMAEPYRNEKEKPTPYLPQDFFSVGRLAVEEKVPRQSWQDQLRIVEQLNSVMGGEDLRLEVN